MEYYYTLIMLSLMSNMVLIIMVFNNKYYKKSKKKALIIIYALVMVGTLCEFIGEAMQSKRIDWMTTINPKMDLWVHTIVKMIELIIAPSLPALMARTIFESEKNEPYIKKIVDAFLRGYYAIVIITTIFQTKFCIFRVDANSTYIHANLYSLYIGAFALTGIYMFFNALCFSKRYQNLGKIEMLAIMAFSFIGIAIPLISGKTKTSWLTVSFMAIMIYNYYGNMKQAVDGMTKLLNQKCFLVMTERKRDEKCMIVIMDLNGFKIINDTYGHSKGDEIIKIFAKILKENFSPIGMCFRRGGDEFALIVNGECIGKFEEMKNKFCKILDEIDLPSTSIGCATYDPERIEGPSMDETIELADKRMYDEKKKYHTGLINKGE